MKWKHRWLTRFSIKLYLIQKICLLNYTIFRKDSVVPEMTLLIIKTCLLMDLPKTCALPWNTIFLMILNFSSTSLKNRDSMLVSVEVFWMASPQKEFMSCLKNFKNITKILLYCLGQSLHKLMLSRKLEKNRRNRI